MTETVTDAEIVDETGTDLERYESKPVNLFGADSAEAVLDRAVSVADALAQVIKQKRLFTNIQGKEHVRVEGWQTLGSMLGVVAVVTHTAPITDSKGNGGWEARCEARTINGNVVGAADAHCSRSERTWKDRDDYALRSMAQTRAVSKALRGPLGFVMELAGFSATPEEEMPGSQEYVRPPWLQSLVDKYGDKKVQEVAKQMWPGHEIWSVDNLAGIPAEHHDAFAQALEGHPASKGDTDNEGGSEAVTDTQQAARGQSGQGETSEPSAPSQNSWAT